MLPYVRHLRTKRSFAQRVFNEFEGFTLLPSGSVIDHADYLHVFPDLTCTAHIKLNCKLKLPDRAAQICSRAPENFCPADSGKAVRRSYSV